MMGTYVQRCPCVSRTLILSRSVERYTREAAAKRVMAESEGRRARYHASRREGAAEQVALDDAGTLLAEAIDLDAQAVEAARLLALTPAGPCHICGGSGHLNGNGTSGMSAGQLHDAHAWDGSALEHLRRTGQRVGA